MIKIKILNIETYKMPQSINKKLNNLILLINNKNRASQFSKLKKSHTQ